MKAYLFPGQGAQFAGMGKDLYDGSTVIRSLFEQANEILGFRISDLMFEGTNEDLRQTRVTQPAIFIHSVAVARNLGEAFQPGMAAGHSLGEFSALVACGALDFDNGLKLVAARASAMQKACEMQPSTMAAILGLEDDRVEEICENISETVVAANYNCPGQLVISGSIEGVNQACEALKEAGARRALVLNVGGAFHSPLMQPAKDELEKAILNAPFKQPVCPVYQNVDANPYTDPDQIRQNLVDQLTSPVRWTQTIRNMSRDGAGIFVECGPGKVLQGLAGKISPGVQAMSA